MAGVKSLFTVLGATGFVGRRLVQRLAQQHQTEVWVPTRQDPLIFQRPLGVVFYCIGLTADYAQRPFDTVYAHVTHLAQLLEHANFEHLVYLSSTRLYDAIETEIGNGDTPLQFNSNNPRHLYDLSKALGENLCLTTARQRSSIARLSCVYDTAPNAPGFLSELLQRIRQERVLNLNSSPGYCRDYITLDDTVACLIAIGRQRACGIFNVASGQNTFNQEIANVLRALGIEIHFQQAGTPMKLARCDIDNLRALGISPCDTLPTFETFAKGFLT